MIISRQEFRNWLAEDPTRTFAPAPMSPQQPTTLWVCGCPVAQYARECLAMPTARYNGINITTYEGAVHETPEWTKDFAYKFDITGPRKSRNAATALAILDNLP